MTTRATRRALLTVGAAASLIALNAEAGRPEDYTAFTAAVPVLEVNIPMINDGCPIESPDGRSLFIASNRPGTLGGNDIWVAKREWVGARWSEPENLGPAINTPTNDFCPTPLPGKWLLFVSERIGPTTCATGPGKGDIYVANIAQHHWWRRPTHLGCVDTGEGPNTTGAEFSPSLVETRAGTWLFFSSDVAGSQDIYVSTLQDDGRFGPPVLIAELSTAADDRMPNVSPDGLEMVFSSSRLTWGNAQPSIGGQDVYRSTRASLKSPWSAPVNLGMKVNTTANETRATISWDRSRLYFGRDGDIYTSTRFRIRGH